MLKKLLKYDLNAIWKLWVALSIAVVGMSLITSLIVRSTIELSMIDENSFGMVISALSAGFMVFGLVMVWSGILLITPIMCYIRYYKNFFSDEGYLTFTLPVRRRDLYLSKVANIFIFNVGNVLVTIAAVLIMMLVIPPAEGSSVINFAAYEAVGDLLTIIWDGIGAWTLVYSLLFILFLAVLSLCEIGMIHLCITVGATVAKKHKVLAGVGIYFGSTFILSSVSQVISMFGMESLVGFVYLLETDVDIMMHLPLLAVFLLFIVMAATVALILHLVTLDTIERKLNLA